MNNLRPQPLFQPFMKTPTMKRFDHVLLAWLLAVSGSGVFTSVQARQSGWLESLPADAKVITADRIQVTGPYRGCESFRDVLSVTDQFVIFDVGFVSSKAKGNCQIGYWGTPTLESEKGTHKLVGALPANGAKFSSVETPTGWLKDTRYFLVFERMGATEDEIVRAAYNPTGKPGQEGVDEARSKWQASTERLQKIIQQQERARAKRLEDEEARISANGGIPAAFAPLNGRMPDVKLFKRLFAKVEPLPDNACSQGVFKTLSKLMANHETSAFLFSPDLTGWFFDQSAYADASQLALMNKTPNPNYDTYKSNKGSSGGRQRGLALVVSEDCKRVYIKTEYNGGYTDGGKYGKTAFSEIETPFSNDFVQGSVKNRSYAFVTDSKLLNPHHGVLPDLDFICTDSKCFKGDLASVFSQGVLKSTDPWTPDLKSAIANLEQQRDKKLAAEKREREVREAREAEERRVAEAEAAKRRAAEERVLNAALQAKDPQAMYLAAGKYEREGDSYRARQVYEGLIERFPNSQWAVKANDQLLQNQRVDAVNSTTRRANAEAGERAYKACRIAMDTCYSQNGNNCYRDCNALR